jgi:hypothetical protein
MANVESRKPRKSICGMILNILYKFIFNFMFKRSYIIHCEVKVNELFSWICWLKGLLERVQSSWRRFLNQKSMFFSIWCPCIYFESARSTFVVNYGIIVVNIVIFATLECQIFWRNEIIFSIEDNTTYLLKIESQALQIYSWYMITLCEIPLNWSIYIVLVFSSEEFKTRGHSYKD